MLDDTTILDGCIVDYNLPEPILPYKIEGHLSCINRIDGTRYSWIVRGRHTGPQFDDAEEASRWMITLLGHPQPE